eukprot:1156735-Pelagomonas_calceolata.AAC.2
MPSLQIDHDIELAHMIFLSSFVNPDYLFSGQVLLFNNKNSPCRVPLGSRYWQGCGRECLKLQPAGQKRGELFKSACMELQTSGAVLNTKMWLRAEQITLSQCNIKTAHSRDVLTFAPCQQ